MCSALLPRPSIPSIILHSEKIQVLFVFVLLQRTLMESKYFGPGERFNILCTQMAEDEGTADTAG